MTLVRPLQRGLDLEHVDQLVDLTECALAPDGQHAALVSRQRDRVLDCYTSHLSLLALDRGEGVLQNVSTLANTAARCLRFSPDSLQLAFIQPGEDGRGDALVIRNIASGRVTTVLRAAAGIADLAWSADSCNLFYAHDTLPDCESAPPVLLLEAIPDRLPWRHVPMRVSMVPSDADASGMPLTTDLIDVNHLCVSSDGRALAFTDERSEGGTHTSIYLNEVELDTGSMRSFRLPGMVVGRPRFSPDGRRLAYVGSRVPGLELRPRSLRDIPAVDALIGYQTNVYDTRVHVVDRAAGTIVQLATDAALAAGIPNGLEPAGEQLRWLSDDEIVYVATTGPTTMLAQQSIHEDRTLTLRSPGYGASRGHSFALDGTCFMSYSELGGPFVPALVQADGATVSMPGPGYQWSQPDRAWHRPSLVEDAPAPGAWLYLPTDERATLDRQSIPLVVQVYGGATPLCLAFDSLHQLLANRGYAVLVVNSSGCSGAGAEVADRHVNDWGRRASADVADTTRLVLERYPRLDPTRVGVYGGSFGGFLVLRLLADSELFRTGCAMAAMTNLAHYWGGSRFGHQYGMTAMSGSFPWSHRDDFVDASPIFSADRISAPLLLVHGGQDSIVPVSEAEQMFVALKMLEREVVLAILPDEEHPIRSCPSVQRAVAGMLIDWFDKQLATSADARQSSWSFAGGTHAAQ
jgi:dipeptidyl aminopeptidase/acylaminoacyl peptidase